MDIVRLDQTISGAERKRGARGPQGIYGLVDIREPDRVRYVGSSDCIAHRLYSHWHSTQPAKQTPKSKWVAEVRASGSELAAIVLERCTVGPRQSMERHEAEGRHIAALSERGQADLNVTLTPVGHLNSTDSRGKLLHAENKRLRKELDELRAEFAALCELVIATRATRCNVAQNVALHSSESCNATQRKPIGYVARCSGVSISAQGSDECDLV